MSMILKYWGIQLKTQLQYKISFILTSIAQFLLFITFYLSIYVMFNKFGNLKEFSFEEVLLCFSVIHLSFYIVEMLARGFDKFENYILSGELDRFLVRPISIYTQVLGNNVAFQKLTRVLQSLAVLIYVIIKLNITSSFINTLTVILMVIGGVAIFFGIFILGAAFCFITIEGLEARNVFTDGGKHMAQYPMGIYKKQFLYFFTFIIPFACVNYYPLLFILGRSSNLYYAFLPLTGVIFLIISILVFNLGMKKYASTGS